uniref:hybrid sensor histidine kinase/response regulator n=1 Tax=Sphingomonas sp. STIS6.2 TaxID=1379700 RepID=UPI00131EAA06
FALSGNERDLIGFSVIHGQAEAQLAALAKMTADNPRQQANIAALRRAIALRFASMEHTIELGRTGHSDDARQIIVSPATQNLTSAITTLAKRVNDEEARLLVQRERRSHDQASLARAVLVGSALVILILAALVWYDRLLQLRALRDANELLAADIRKRELVEAQLQLLATNATDAVFRLGLDGRFQYASPSTKQVFGIEPARVIGRDVSWGIHPDDRAAVVSAMELLASGANERLLITYRSAQPDLPETWRWVESNAGVVRDPSGQPTEIIASLRDISKRKQLELDLEAARLRAETAAHAKSTFLANMSHEIRTPMNGVIGFTELLLSSELPCEQRRQAELIADSGRAMMRLLNDILDLSKVEAGQMRIADEPFDLRHTLRACVRLVTPAAEQKGLVLDVNIDDALPTTIRGDGLRLRQIILNLLGNATKFTLNGGITLRVRPISGESAGGAALLIEVEDTGIGVAPERRAAIFETFVQAEATTAGRFGGTGLGLPISARLAELMGGRLVLDDADRQGARFVLSLPLVPCDEDEARIPIRATEAITTVNPLRPDPAGSPPRILVAEDHDVNQLLITAMLQQLGYDPSIAADGGEAIAMVEAARAEGQPYALVLMDIQMPVMDGPEATRRLRAEGISADELPIIALTANAYADDVSACLTAGMQAHLAKPVTLAGLDGMLSQWMRRASVVAPITSPRTVQPSARVRGLYEVRKGEALQTLADMVKCGQFSDVELDRVAGMLHKLAGTAAMFGEATLGDAARALEDGITEWSSETRIDQIRSAIDTIRKAA